MRNKPTTIKGALKELIDRCEGCGSREFNISTYQYLEGPKKKGFFATIGEVVVPADPEEYKRYLRKKELENRKGMEIEYYCTKCGDYYTQFYDQKTLNFFLETFKQKYNIE